MITANFIKNFGFSIQILSKICLIPFHWKQKPKAFYPFKDKSRSVIAFKIQCIIHPIHILLNGVLLGYNLIWSPALNVFGNMLTFIWFMTDIWAFLTFTNLWNKRNEISWIFGQLVVFDTKISKCTINYFLMLMFLLLDLPYIKFVSL